MKKVLVVACLIFFIVLYFSYTSNSHKYSEKEMLSNQILNMVAKQLKEEKALYVCGTGGGMIDKIRKLHLSFFYYHPIDIDEGRELIVYAVNALNHAINANEKIRPYLNTYPFSIKNTEIVVFLHNSNGSDVVSGGLSVIACREGGIEYKTLANQERMKFLHVLLEETYEEAVLKIQEGDGNRDSQAATQQLQAS